MQDGEPRGRGGRGLQGARPALGGGNPGVPGMDARSLEVVQRGLAGEGAGALPCRSQRISSGSTAACMEAAGGRARGAAPGHLHLCRRRGPSLGAGPGARSGSGARRAGAREGAWGAHLGAGTGTPSPGRGALS